MELQAAQGAGRGGIPPPPHHAACGEPHHSHGEVKGQRVEPVHRIQR